MVVPGFAANETLLYSPELKFGWTRGLMMASVMGVLMGRKLAEKEGC